MVIPCFNFRTAAETAFQLAEAGAKAAPVRIRGRWVVRVAS